MNPKFKALKQADDTLPPQAKVIVSTLASRPEGVSRPILVAMLEGCLNTQQPAARILSFYTQRLISEGFISREDDGETPAKPAAKKDEMKKVATVSIKLADLKLNEAQFKRLKSSPTVEVGAVALPVIRAFELESWNEIILICGEDADDQDVWILQTGPKTATLVGTLNATALAEVLKTKELNLSCSDDFEWLNESMVEKTVSLHGKHCGAPALKKHIDGVEFRQIDLASETPTGEVVAAHEEV